MTLRVLQVSDSHLSERAPYSVENWDAVVACAADLRPDLVVHTGDISLDGATRPEDLTFARAHVERLPAPWVAIPGNHDIGDVAPEFPLVDPPRRARYAAAFGETRFARTVDGWSVVGFDVQTLMTPSPAADDLWHWLDGALDGAAPTALFLHRPLQPLAEDDADHVNRYVTAGTRERLTALIGSRDVRLVGSGHVHQWREGAVGGVAHVWAPSSWAVIPDAIQPVIGTKVVGAVLHTLHPDGRTASELVVPGGIAQVASGASFPSPYA